jgi:hypothetical protein
MQWSHEMNKQELDFVLQKHRLWLEGKEGGKRADLRYADLTGADLTGADLRDAVLAGADLTGAVLRDAVLARADLTGADLTDAVLARADLTGAVLRGSAGNMRELKSIFIDTWPITYTSDVLQIGCHRHAIEQWWQFTDEEISKMDSEALGWWNKYSPIIKQIIELSPAVPTGEKQ